MAIKENLQRISKEIPENVTLVAVSKTRSVEEIAEAIEAGQKIFGENKVQELQKKAPEFSGEIEWHLIGHLQSNKVKYIASFVSLIHSVDSLRLLKEINKQGLKNNRVIDCLLQIHIAKEESKFGFSFEEAFELFKGTALSDLNNIRIRGLMGMATNTENELTIRNEFRELKMFFNEIKKGRQGFTILCMGMSGDYKIAVQEGSTMVRIGTAIFGEREYTT